MTAPKEIIKLIERFEQNREQYTSGNYNETQLRLEFLNPFFSALGWDVENRQGHAEPYKEVIHEDAIKVGTATKAPDYAFRIGGTRKFFVEAKKPSHNLKEDISPSYQLRRYAWSAKLPLSILSDFEEFAVYDCRIKPLKTDKASAGRLLYLTSRQYVKEWDSIASIFSKDAVLKGSFDKYAESTKGKKGTAEVDDAFLKEIESWRDVLAKNIALRNPKLSQKELNFAVQRTIDRIIFLRICEDRGIEPYGRLQALVNGERSYARLCEQFYRADERYNSGLFHFESGKGRPEQPDELTPRLHIDDKPLKDIIRNLYYPDCPYEFSVLPADILGQVYEQFLGKVIRLTAGHQAKVEEKPEVKKAGGVYYTPTYIVDYIVKNTVGKLLVPEITPTSQGGEKEGASKPRRVNPLTPKDASKLRILDPACGSGSFLIGAYQYLLDWHRDWYVDDGPEKHSTGKNTTIFRGPGGEWRLTTAERKRILLNNIYGVDIDSQAVEVTKLSLLLKVLEGENEQTISQQFKMFHERALPDLGSNIKCGNSLIGPDFYDGKQLSLLDDDDRNRINVFDWKNEFKDIMDAGGFDAVIGNPPYVRIQAMKEWARTEVEFYKDRYHAAAQGNYDLYVVFAEKGLNLLRRNGLLGYILPNKFFNADYGKGLREVINAGNYLRKIVSFGDQQVFSNATTYTCLLFLSRHACKQFEFVRVDALASWKADWNGKRGIFPCSQLAEPVWNFSIGGHADLRKRLSSTWEKLGDVAHIFQGLVTGADKVFIVDSAKDFEKGLLRPFLLTGNIRPYDSPFSSCYIIFPYNISDVEGKAELIPPSEIKKRFPKTWDYFKSHENILRARERGKWDHDGWHALGRSQNLNQMDSPKLIIQVTALRPTVILDEVGLYMTGGGSGPFYGLRPFSERVPLTYLLGILNSRVFGWLIRSQSTPLRGGYIKFSKQYIQSAPIPLRKTEVPSDKSRHDKLVELVEQMLSLHRKLPVAKTEQEKTVIQRQIEATDMQIDELVYELYGLTEEEIKIVEGKT